MHRRDRPPEEQERRRGEGRVGARDATPALGHRGEPGRWRRAVEGAAVALQRRDWEDARWSFLYDAPTRYAAEGADGEVPAAARRMRGGREVPGPVHGPVVHAPVWTWEVPLYFWFGGIATGSSFVAVAAEAAGDAHAAQTARRLTLAAVAPAPALLVLDLGRPERFLHMLRIFKPRSAMSMGAWCLVAFSGTAAGGVGADLTGRPRLARALGAATAASGTYLGSYTGVLLAATAIPVWARSRALLPPIFVCTAAATGAAANRLVLAATGLPADHPTQRALRAVETGAMGTELALTAVNERRLGPAGEALRRGRPGRLLPLATWAVRGGLALRLARRSRPVADHGASVLFLLAGLAHRFAWLAAGPLSADDDETVAATARGG